MLSYVILGATFAFAAALQPGPLQSYFISQSLSKGWKHTLPAVFAPIITDGPIILVIIFLLSRFPIWFISVLQIAGGAFLLYLAIHIWIQWRRYDSKADMKVQLVNRSLKEAVVINFLSPSPYLGWSLVMGPLLIKGWSESPMHGIALLVSFYSSMIICSTALVLLFASARKLGSKVTHVLLGLSAIALACFGLYQLWLGMKGTLIQ